MTTDIKVALVTGATRGIGKAIAINLSEAGFVVIGTATSENGAQSITDYLSSAGNTGKGYVLNVADFESIPVFFKEITAAFGAPDVVVNNAGITHDNLLLRMKTNDWDSVINTNLSSVFHISKTAIKTMTKKRWGRIINISSVVGSAGNPGQANYCASKAGVDGLTRSMAHELGGRNITVNSVAPGFIATDMTKDLPEEQKEALQSGIALKRLGQPEEIASAVGFLASEGASYITGVTLHVNGGMYMN